MHSPQLVDAALYAALAADTTLARLAAPEDHRHTQIAGALAALAALERLDEPQALCAFIQTSAELATALGAPEHARTVEALCDLHAAALTLAAHASRHRAAGAATGQPSDTPPRAWRAGAR